MDAQLWVNSLGKGAPIPELLEPVQRPYRWNKPRGGLWTSTLAGPGSWVHHCLTKFAHGFLCDPTIATYWLLDVAEHTRVFEIRGIEDLRHLHSEFPDDSTEPCHPEGTGGVDWLRVAEQFDAVHATHEAITELDAGDLALREFSGDDSPNLCGWEVESTVWFRWRFSNVRATSLAEVQTLNVRC